MPRQETENVTVTWTPEELAEYEAFLREHRYGAAKGPYLKRLWFEDRDREMEKMFKGEEK